MSDRTRVELSAMQAIADAVSALPDAETRDRVLRWVAEHFASAPEAPAAPWTVPESSSAQALAPKQTVPDEAYADPENLDSLFDNSEVPTIAAHAAVRKQRTVRPPVTSVLRSFVADFQQLAHDWEKSA